MRKKILVLTSTFPRWEKDYTASFIYGLEKKIAKKFDVYVLAPHYKGARKYEIVDNLKIHRFQYFWPPSFQKLCYGGGILPNLKKNKLLVIQTFTLMICELITAIKIIKKEKIELVHAFWFLPQGIVAMIVKLFLNVDYIVTALGGDMFPFKTNNKLFLWFYKKIADNASFVTAVNQIFVKELKTLNQQKIYYVPNGVDIHNLKPAENIKKNTNILFVGRLTEKKGVIYLIEALKKIDKKIYNKLLIVGDGPLRIILEKKVRELGIENKVYFFGSKPYKELFKFYNESMFIVVPSITTSDGDREGFPTVYLDAMACGCPIIASRIEGIENIIKNNENGIIVEQKNPAALAKTMNDLIYNDKLRNSITKNALIEVKNKYAWNIVSERYIKLIKNI